MMKSKRGSISISINMIVVVVLAFVMLGLMLTLGRNIVDSAGKTANQVSEQTRQDIINKLTQSDDPLYFTQREFNVPFKKAETISFGVKNIDPSQAHLAVEIIKIDSNGEEGASMVPSTKSSGDEGVFYWPKVAQMYGAGESKVFDVQYRAPTGTRGSYMYKFRIVNIENPSESVAEQIIYINVI